jgi:N-acetylated-alpha-linked acidic dipeptidase
MGELVKTGWRPRRTLVYAGWDGEEQALIGSTEWVETHAEALREKAVAYVNSDGNARGFLGVGGSHTLERFVNEVARDVVDPQKGVSVAERWIAAAQIWELPEAIDEERQSFHLDALGSGSDFTPFLQHLGVASLNVGYGGEEQYGQYHSTYDSFDHYVRFVDPDFRYGVTLAQTAGRMMLRLAQAEVLPFDLGPFAAAVSKYAEDVQGVADRLRKEAVDRNQMLADRVYELTADPTETWVPPPPLDPVPYLSFAPLQNAVARLNKSAAAFEKARAGLEGKSLAPDTRNAVNAILLRLERSLTRPEGLPGRPWYKHYVYAPGRYAGYRVSTLPAVREAIQQRRWREAEEQIVVLAKTLESFAAEVDKATALLESAGSVNPGGL